MFCKHRKKHKNVDIVGIKLNYSFILKNAFESKITILYFTSTHFTAFVILKFRFFRLVMFQFLSVGWKLDSNGFNLSEVCLALFCFALKLDQDFYG